MKEFHSPLSAGEANYFIIEILISCISELSMELQKLQKIEQIVYMRLFIGRTMVHTK